MLSRYREWKSYISYAFWVPYEIYIKDFSKFHCLPPVLSSWWSSIHLLELKIQMWKITPCHTSNELHLWSYLSKIWLKVSKTCDISCFLLMYGKGGFFIFDFSTPKGGLRTIRKTELEENNGILKNSLYALKAKGHNICRILPPNWLSCKNEMAYFDIHYNQNMNMVFETSSIV